MKRFFCLIVTGVLATTFAYGQTGLTVGPPRVFFVADAGQEQIQYVDVTNPSKDYTMELAVSIEDWAYSAYGDNVVSPKGTLPTSCADWLSVSEPFFALKPGETKRLQVSMQVPKGAVYSDSIPIRTVMFFVTQLNPRTGAEREGANIRLAVRTGIKIYHRFSGKDNADLEITDLKYVSNDSIGHFLEIGYDVTGNIWLEGQMRVEFINQEDGKKTIVDDIAFYSLPNDKRKQLIGIPEGLPSGSYTASILLFYGGLDMVKAAELDFDYDPDM